MNIPAANPAPQVAARQPAAPPATLDGAAPPAPAAQPKDEVSLSTRGVRMAEDAPGVEERIANFASRTEGRLDLLAQSGYGSSSLDEVAKQFSANVARVQAGIESGGLDASGVARGLQNALSFLREGVRTTLGFEGPKSTPAPEPTVAPAPPALESAPTAPSPGLVVEPEAQPPALESVPSDPSDPRVRLAGLGTEIAERLASLDFSNLGAGQKGTLSSLTADFESTLGRLDHALDKGALGKERLSAIVASAIDDLSAGLSKLLESDQGLSTYGPTAGVDGFNTGAHVDGHA